MAKKPVTPLSVETLTHDESKRKNIPTVEFESVMREDEQHPIPVAYARRNRDLDPQLVWRGKDVQDWSDLIVQAAPLYIQEKVHPKVLIDDLRRRSAKDAKEQADQTDLFSDFNGLPSENAKTEFYEHDSNWSNRMILGDSLQVMASLAEREKLRGEVQCIYFDPPYGIKFNSNFQWSTTSRDVKDGNTDHITREPEQVKAFRDTWRDGIHSYLTYLRDRLTVARDLLTESGSIFVQIGDENVHLVRSLMDEVFGDDNFIIQIDFATTTSQTSQFLSSISDHILWFGKDRTQTKFRELKLPKDREKQEVSAFALYEHDFVISRNLMNENARLLVYGDLTSRSGGDSSRRAFNWFGQTFIPNTGGWKTSLVGLERLGKANRLGLRGKNTFYKRYFDDWPFSSMSNAWMDTQSGGLGVESRIYVVQTNVKVIERCILMTTDPGDLVLDPTCGSGTTAYVAEQWGRRWMTIDTSRVALALARARVMGARYPYYLLADSPDGQIKEAEVTRAPIPSSAVTRGSIRQGFVYERVPHITLKSIANNTEIDVIWEKYQTQLEPLRASLNTALKQNWQEWEIPRDAEAKWSAKALELHKDWWAQRIARQKEIDASIAAKAEYEYLYDKPYDDKKKVRVAGPFTVESLSPHRVLALDENDEFQETNKIPGERDFVQIILETLRVSGVQQAHKTDKIVFSSLIPFPGEGYVCAEGRYFEGNDETTRERKAGIFIGPEFGTVSRQDLVRAAREAADNGFDILIACAFNFDAHSSDFDKLGKIPILKARMNADLHMATDLKNTGKGNLFVIFGEPDIKILALEQNQICVQVLGIDVFHPSTGEVRSDGADGIACWFIDTDYNEESFFVRQAYFLGQNDPYKALKTTLKAEINEDAWATLNSDTSRAFNKPTTGRIAVKVINHLGDEVMKVFKVV
jgi:adenine-specific DNA-methyltransferase